MGWRCWSSSSNKASSTLLETLNRPFLLHQSQPYIFLPCRKFGTSWTLFELSFSSAPMTNIIEINLSFNSLYSLGKWNPYHWSCSYLTELLERLWWSLEDIKWFAFEPLSGKFDNIWSGSVLLVPSSGETSWSSAAMPCYNHVSIGLFLFNISVLLCNHSTNFSFYLI